jgi:hypothetical protein
MGRYLANRWGLPAVQIIRLRFEGRSGEFGRIGAVRCPLFDAECGRLEVEGWLAIRTVVITIHLPYCRITTYCRPAGERAYKNGNSSALIAVEAREEETLRKD